MGTTMQSSASAAARPTSESWVLCDLTITDVGGYLRWRHKCKNCSRDLVLPVRFDRLRCYLDLKLKKGQGGHGCSGNRLSSEEVEGKIVAAKQGAEKLGYTWADAKRYTRALAKWAVAGFPTRTQEEVVRIEAELCRPCEYYRDGRCRKCGCNVNTAMVLLNKIRMATEHCPLDPPKW